MSTEKEPEELHRQAWKNYVAIKASTEYESDARVFVNKISACVFRGFAKIKGSFQREHNGEFSHPMFGLSTRFLNLLYDCQQQNMILTLHATNWFGSRLHLKYRRNIKAHQGEAILLATTKNAKYKAELSHVFPLHGRVPRAVLSFPCGEIKMEDSISEDGKRYKMSGFLEGFIFRGLMTAEYHKDILNLKYRLKDRKLTIIPSIMLPSKSPSVALKRQFNLSNKLSYFYDFDSTVWSVVYKHKLNEELKIKAGYNSDVRLAWASAWVGKEELGAKQAPRKCKLQVMLQVPQDDPQNYIILFCVKKRLDL